MSGSPLLRVTLSGYYGCGNAGDEAVLAGIISAFRLRAEGRVSLLALSQRPEETRALHGIDASPRMDLRSLRTVIGSSDLLISGGGSLLQDTTSLKSLLYYLYVMHIARSRGVPFMLYAQGIGPLRRAVSRKLVRRMLNRAAYITVRDAGSADLLNAIGVNAPKIEVTADPAFALDPAPGSAVDELLKREGIPLDRPMIGVALRPWGDTAGSTAIERFRRLLKELQKQSECQIVLLPMHFPDDLEFARKIDNGGDYSLVSGIYPPEVVLGLVSRMSAVVAMRLHTLIFAARAAVPMFALAYDPKVWHLMNRLELSENAADCTAFDPADVASRITGMLARRAELSASLNARSESLRTAALRNCDVALEVLGAACGPSPLGRGYG